MVLYNRMAKTKQTARKTDPTTGRRMKSTTASSSEDEVSPGGGGNKLLCFPSPHAGHLINVLLVHQLGRNQVRNLVHALGPLLVLQAVKIHRAVRKLRRTIMAK